MGNLHIIEIAPHVHAGYVNKWAQIDGGLVNTPSGYEELSIPSGGISFLFNKIYDLASRDTVVFTADRYASYKKSLDPNYKANRKSDSDKERKGDQQHLAELILIQCGFQVFSEEGYESDDLVFSLAEKYKKHYDKVYIHTGDSDMYVCVDDNVEILPASSKGKHITKENYSRTVDSKGIVPYNSLSFSKVLWGETGDNIPKLPAELANRMRQAFYTPFYFARMGDKPFMREVVKALFPEALNQFDLVYPATLDVYLDMDHQPDLMKAAIWGSLVGNRKFPKPQSIPFDVRELKQSLFEPGSKYLD